MKKILLSTIYFFAAVSSTQAQVLFGTTSEGGSDGVGTIHKFIPGTNKLTVVKSLERAASHPYYSSLVQANNGKLYGMTSTGGSSNAGVIFSLDAAASAYTMLKSMDIINGASPYGSLLQAANGKLYGMTTEGGNTNDGVIFSFDPSSSTYSKLKDFDGTGGARPFGSLIQAGNGKLYGMTNEGGSNNNGVIFSFDPDSFIYTRLIDFSSTKGTNPYGNLVQAKNGKLYGMTYEGGVNGDGVIFSFDPSSFSYKTLVDFKSDKTGANPYGSLVQSGDGKLYGMTSVGGSGGGGVIFSVDPAGSPYKVLKDFVQDFNGDDLSGSLIQAKDGKLYGMTENSIFSLDRVSSLYTTLSHFVLPGDGVPYGSLLQATDGKLYGMTSEGGISGNGIIFSFDLASAHYSRLKDFAGNAGGSFISSSLTQAVDGKLYGMTTNGGSKGYGVIFSFDASSSKYAKLKDFDYVNGGAPDDDLMQATDGKLYGMTPYGGSHDLGVIFSFDPGTRTYKKLKDFDSASGAVPIGSLVQAGNGKLYGVTDRGGRNDAGVIFSLDPSSSTYTKIKDFKADVDGTYPASLMQAKDGRLYGMTRYEGKKGYGAIFSFNPANATYTKLKDLFFTDDEDQRSSAVGRFIQAGDGKLYGRYGINGDDSYHGGIFSFDPLSSEYKDFNILTGFPTGSFMQASDGKLYGTTGFLAEEARDDGTIFSFDPSSSAYTELVSFNRANGSGPNGPLVEIRGCAAGTAYYRDADGDGYGNPADSVTGCPIAPGYVDNKRDCNDANAAMHPGAPELCNGSDDDCDGQIDAWTLEAETAVLHGALIAASQLGYTGSGFADYQKAAGDYVEWTVNAATAGSYSLQFRYANGGTTDRFLQLSVNGKAAPSNFHFPSTGSWATWQVSSGMVNLTAGVNKIRLTTSGSDGPNIDHLTVKILGCSPNYLEAEEAALQGAVIANSEPGYTGTGYANYKNNSGDFIVWTINNVTAGSYVLHFRYANGAGGDKPLQVKVNGIVVNANLSFPPTGSWATWSVASTTVNLGAGTNSIRLITNGLNGSNIDNLSFESNTTIESVQGLAKSLQTPATAIFKAEVAPNPVEGSIAKVMVSTSSNLPIKLELFDISGKSSRTLRFMPKGSNTFNLPVYDLMPGVYTVILKQGNLSTHARLVVGRR